MKRLSQYQNYIISDCILKQSMGFFSSNTQIKLNERKLPNWQILETVHDNCRRHRLFRKSQDFPNINLPGNAAAKRIEEPADDVKQTTISN